jgi:hypothetical protein
MTGQQQRAKDIAVRLRECAADYARKDEFTEYGRLNLVGVVGEMFLLSSTNLQTVLAALDEYAEKQP